MGSAATVCATCRVATHDGRRGEHAACSRRPRRPAPVPTTSTRAMAVLGLGFVRVRLVYSA